MAGFDDFKLLDEWYKAAIAAGAVIAVPAVTTGNTPAFLCGVGLVLFGVGEFINHPRRSQLLGNEFGDVVGTRTSRARDPRLFGYALDVGGLALLVYGISLLILRN